MNKKLIALDLDGTLLKSDYTVGEKTKKLLNELMENSHHVAIATGRILSSAKATAQTLGINCHLVSCNGGLAYHHSGKIVKAKTFDADLSHRIINILLDYGIYYHFYTEDTIYCQRLDHTAKAFKDSLKSTVYPHIKDVIVIDDVYKILNQKHNIYKFCIYQDNSYDFNAVRSKLNAVAGVYTVFSNKNLLDVMLNGVNKWQGVKALADYLKIDNKNIIAFGDNDNDLEMIKCAGQGVVMANGKDSVKVYADTITDSNDQEGVYTYLKNNLDI